MHKLNGERLKPPTEPAQPGNYLLYHGQQLNDHADYFAEAAHMGSGCQPGFEGEVPESPMTKQLREEQKRQNISEQQSAGHQQVEAKVLKRPSSGGNDAGARGFALLPPPLNKAQTACVAESTIFCFAPMKKTIGYVPNDSSEHDRHRSHTLAASPQPQISSQMHLGQRAHFVPKTGGVGPTEKETHEAITVTSDPDHSDVEDDVQDMEDPQEPGTRLDIVAPEQIDGTNPNGTPVQRPLPLGSELGAIPDRVRSSLQHSPGLAAEPSVGGNEAAEETATPATPATLATPATAPGSLGAPRAPKSRYPRQVLVTPACVGKASHRAKTKTSRAQHLQMTPESTSPSEEDLLYVLMHRCRERGEATQRSMTKIQTLEHRNFELHFQTQEISQERDAAIAAQNDAIERHSSLQTNLDGFRSRYRKLKDFARSTHEDLVLLRRSADEQKASIQGLRQLGDEVQTALRDAGTEVQVVRTSLDKQRQGLAVIHSEASRIVSESRHVSAELGVSSGRIKELTREKGRLEGHIVSLENAQQRATYAARNSNQDASTALAKVNQRLDGIEFAALQPPRPSSAAEQCLVLLRSLHEGKEPTAKDFQKLAKSVTTLKTMVVNGVQSIGGDLRSLQVPKRAEDSEKLVEKLAKFAADLQLSAPHVQHSNAERIELKARLRGALDTIENLQKSVAQADSYVATFQKGMETVSSSFSAQQKRLVQLQNQSDQFQIRWNSKTSALATVERESADRTQSMSEEIARLLELLSAQRFERAVVEEDLRLARQEPTETLDKDIQALLIELNEKTVALDQAKAATSAARSEGDEVAAMLAQQLENLRRSHSSLQSSDRSLQSTNERLQSSNDAWEAANDKLTSENKSLQSSIESLQSTSETQKSANRLLSETIETPRAADETSKSTNESLQSTINSLQSGNKTLNSSNESLQSSNDSLQSTNEKLQTDVRNTRQEQEKPQRQLEEALQGAQGAKEARTQLKVLESRCEQADREIKQLLAAESQLSELRQRFELQQKDLDSSNTDVSRLREQLANAEKYPAIIEELNSRVKHAEAETKGLREALNEATAKVAELDDLQKRLASMGATIEKLGSEVSASCEARKQLAAVSVEKVGLLQDLSRVRSDLEVAQEQIQKSVGLEERLRKQHEEIAQLRPQADRAQQLSQTLAALKQESQQKDSCIASLLVNLDRTKAESQGSADAHATNPEPQLTDLDEFATQQSQISFLQTSQTRRRNASQSRRSQDQYANHIAERPQRRVADRSAPQEPVLPPPRLSQSDFKGSQPQSTNSTDLVPNSQTDAHIRDALGMDELDHGDHGDLSPLSAVQSDDEEPIGEGPEKGGSSQGEIPETLQDTIGPFQRGRGHQTQNGTIIDRDLNLARPSSSAASVDLFKQHETNLEAATHPWEDSQPYSNAPDQSRSIRGHGHPKPTSQSIVAPGQLDINSFSALPAGKISPKTTRSGTQFSERFTTPTPESSFGHVQGMMNITPTMPKERHQPNSAVKRSAEGDGPPAKRLERHPERLAVRKPSKPTNHSASDPSQSKTMPGSRKGGSVVGTPAPAPGKTQKSSKAIRKHSKKDKYSAKFVESS